MDADAEGGEEVGLFAGGFKGRCFYCGKQGHRARDCREKMNESGGSGTGGGSGTTSDGGNWQKFKTCYYCKEDGHISTNCPKLKAKKEREQAL